MKKRSVTCTPSAVGAVMLFLVPACAGSDPSTDGDGGSGGETSGPSGGSSNGTDSGGSTSSGGGTGTYPRIEEFFDAEVGVVYLGRGPFSPMLSEFSDEGGTRHTVGEMTLSDPATGVEIVFLDTGDATRPPTYPAGIGLGGGETLAFSTTGGLIAPFTGSLEIPLPLLISSHSGTTVVEGTIVVTVPRGEDLVVTWDARGADAVWAQTLVDLTHGWSFDPASGTGTIPTADLQAVGASERIVFYSVNLTRIETSHGTFDLWGQFHGVTPGDETPLVFLLP